MIFNKINLKTGFHTENWISSLRLTSQLYTNSIAFQMVNSWVNTNNQCFTCEVASSGYNSVTGWQARTWKPMVIVHEAHENMVVSYGREKKRSLKEIRRSG